MKHDLLDLIDYHEKKAKQTKSWSTANDGEATKQAHFFHVRSVQILTKILEETYGK
jgi:LPS sulfotransferase NodH